LRIICNNIKRRQVKGRSQLNYEPTTYQPTLESLGFQINNEIGVNAAHATSIAQNSSIPICYPFVKWAGGKRQIVPHLSALAPSKFDMYFEPFLGGAALFFNLISDKNKQFAAYISDINPDLINAYETVKDNVEKLIKLLTQHKIEYNKAPEAFYYDLRDNYSSTDNVERAARFIALNRTCFNGLYRVNRKGEFNVPWGKYKNPSICNSNNLRNVSHTLHNNKVTIKAADYKDILLQNAKEGDFIYLDPPYSPESTTAYFTSYTTNGFSNKDQEKLAETYKQLDEMKCKVMLTNSNTPLVRELYAPFAITEVDLLEE
jgi:DNA adenine methylase